MGKVLWQIVARAVFGGLAMAWMTTALAGATVSSPATTGPLTVDTLGDRLNREAAAHGGLGVTPTAQGAELRSRMQHLLGVVGSDGLRVTSTAPGTESAVPLRLTADRLGRVDMPGESLPRTGTVQRAGELVRYVRPGVVEEFSVSADGIRQDFLVPTPPAGEGELRLELALSGATALRPHAGGILLSLDESGRELVYHRLHVTDANGTVLPAAMHRLGPARLAIDVDDHGAAWPLRIDPTITDADWVGFGGPPGVGMDINGINAIAVDSRGHVYIAGDFWTVGDTLVNQIAKWDGNDWLPLGDGFPQGNVYALAVDSSNHLYVGGSFLNHLGNAAADTVVRWDGAAWHAVGSGLNSTVVALAIDPTTDELYAGGFFTGHLAVFSGGAWSVTSGLNDAVNVLLFMPTGDLYVGGDFTNAGGVAAADRIALLSKGAWFALGPGLNHEVDALAYDAVGKTLYAGGWFTNAGGDLAADYLAAWDGTNWSDVAGALDQRVTALLVDSNGRLHVAGRFGSIGGNILYRDYVIRDGSSWLVPGLDSSPEAFAEDPTGLVWVGGAFTGTATQPLASLAVWDGSLNLALGVPDGISGEVNAILVASNGDLIIGGDFENAFGVAAADNLARWDGNTWSDLGGGVSGSVNALAEDSLGNIYVGGNTAAYGGISGLNRFARWDGSSWSSLGGNPNGQVAAIVIDDQDRIYIGGAFPNVNLRADTVRIACWDGTNWQPLGSGLNGTVRALAINSNGDLYAGGDFTATEDGQALTRVARWNGTNWHALGGGLNGGVRAMAVDSSDRLVVGGSFLDAGGVPDAYLVARWNGSAWSALGASPFSQPLDAVAIAPDGTIYAGGDFTSITDPGTRIAMWDGVSWQPLGSGTNSDVEVLFYDAVDEVLYVGGTFAVAGGTPAGGIAQVLIPTGPIDPAFADDVDEDNISDSGFDVGSEGSPLSLDALLAVTDGNRNETLTWTVTGAPAHGTLAGFPTTASTNGGLVAPTGLTYEADAKYIGSDAFIVAVSDGTHTAQLKVDISVLALHPPGTLTASVTSGLVSLLWDDRSSTETGYRVERRPSGGSWSEIIQLPANSQFYDDAPPGGETYQYRVRAYQD